MSKRNWLGKGGRAGFGKNGRSRKVLRSLQSLLVLVYPSTDTFVLLCFSSGSRGGYNKGKCTGSNVRCLYINISDRCYVLVSFVLLQHTKNGRLHLRLLLYVGRILPFQLQNLRRALYFLSNA